MAWRRRWWGWGWVAGAMAAAWGGAAGGAVLDVGELEREVRRDVAAFEVATGSELTPERRAALGVEEALTLAAWLRELDGEATVSLYEELAGRELSPAERLRVLGAMLYCKNTPDFGCLHDYQLTVAERLGIPLVEAWEAGELPEENRKETLALLFEFCHAEWMAHRVFGEDGEEEAPSEEANLWERRSDALWEVLDEMEGGSSISWKEDGRVEFYDGESRGRQEREKQEKRLAAAGWKEGLVPENAAEWQFRRGVEMSMLGRNRDAEAAWREAERLAEEAGDAALLREVRAARAVDGDWRWRRAERRALCEAELAAGSPWREFLLKVLADEAAAEEEWTEATERALEGLWEYGGMEWAIRAGRAVSAGGGGDLALWIRVCGERLEEIPAVEARRAEIRALVEFRWAAGALFPEQVEATLEGDLARLRERAGEWGGRDEKDGRDGRDGGEGEEEEEEGAMHPGARWRVREPSWKTDAAVPEIEREFNEILAAGWRAPEGAWAAWREKWSEEERRALKVDGGEAEFAARVDEFRHENCRTWEELKELGLRALEAGKAQERYDPGRLCEVLVKLVHSARVAGPADAAEITEWTEWARRAAMGDTVVEDEAAVAELIRAVQVDDEAAVRRLAGDEERVAALCWYPFGWRGEFRTPWTLLARWGGEREAVRLAILHVRMSGDTEAGQVAALMDVMTAAELAELREAWRLAALVRAAAALDGGGESPLRRLAGNLGSRREDGAWNAEWQERLARLTEAGAEGGVEGQALAKALGEESARGAVARLGWRMAGGVEPEEADDGSPDEWRALMEARGRWREWCRCVEEIANGMEDGWRVVSGSGSFDGGLLPPWLERMAERRLSAALAYWGAEATEKERAAIAQMLEFVGERTGAEAYGDWLEAARAAGPWAVEALERGRVAEERRKAAEAAGGGLPETAGEEVEVEIF